MVGSPGRTGVRRPLRVALPLVNLVPGAMGGSETYVRELAAGLATVDGLDPVALTTPLARGAGRGMREAVSRTARGGDTTLGRLLLQASARMDPGLRRELAKVDVVHYPLSVVAPRAPGRVPVIVTIHDVQHLELPGLFSRPERLYRRATYDRAALRSSAVITMSEFSRRAILSHLDVAPERVHAIPLGVDPSFRPRPGPKGDYVLYPARPWPHKNHPALIEAMTLVRRTLPDLRLVLTGGGLDALGALPSWVDRRGLVPHEELVSLYQGASCLAFVSSYEGFGLPVIEAMAAGCPVASSDAGSLPEVCGEAAVLFDARDPAAIADAIARACRAGDSAIEAGLARARGYTWESCVRAHEELYREVAARGPIR